MRVNFKNGAFIYILFVKMVNEIVNRQLFTLFYNNTTFPIIAEQHFTCFLWIYLDN